MRTPALIALAALVGFVLAWLLLTRVPQPAAVPAAPVAHVPAVASVAVVPPPSPPEHGSPVIPAMAKPGENRPGDPAKALPPIPPSQPQPQAVEKTPDESSTSEAPVDDAAQSEGAADGEIDAEDGPPPIDTDRAADLIADLIAHQEAASDESGVPNATAQAWKKFDQEQPDPEWSEPTAQQIEQTLDQWLAGLPEDVQQHIAVIHLECRATMCQILAADNDIDTQTERAQAGQEWQQAIASLPGQTWWNELGFVDASTQVTANEGHTLYMTYLRREVKPPPA